MRFIVIQLAVVTLTSTISLAGPASKAFSLKWQFGSGADGGSPRVMMDAFEIRRTLEQIQRPEATEVQIDSRDLETREDLELKKLQAMDPNLEFTGETVNVEAFVRTRRRVSEEELLGGSTIRPSGAAHRPKAKTPVTVTGASESDR